MRNLIIISMSLSKQHTRIAKIQSLGNHLMAIKDILSKIPYSADLYDAIRRSRPRTRYNLDQLKAHLPAAVEQVRSHLGKTEYATGQEIHAGGKKIVLFATLHYWVEQAAIVGLTLRGLGYDVTVAYLPYGDWRKEINAFDLRRQDLYTRRVLAPLKGLVKIVSLLDCPERSVPQPVLAVRPGRSRRAGFDYDAESASPLSPELTKAIETVSAYDAMYTNQEENVDRESALYRLRVERNGQAALAAMCLLQASRPDVVLIPNGTITELGAVYQVARHLGINTVTYEFNDQREQVWIAQNDEVMRQNTDLLWAARGGQPLTSEQREKIEALEAARMGGRAFGKSSRAWQDLAAVGGEKIRADLGLDQRPVVLLATNVLGDSLTLGRNLFAASMAEWITKTVQYFATRTEVQLVVRVHPGERLTHGLSMVDVINAALPEVPAHIHVVKPLEKVNTYDLMEITGLGLVYTTTTGMEMSMNGIPVIACGETHYRERGFTFDSATWEEYFGTLDRLLTNLPISRLTDVQIETAWEYAYRFFFEYPIPFPWRLMHFWKDLDTWPVSRVLSEEGRAEFGKAFDYLAGEPVNW